MEGTKSQTWWKRWKQGVCSPVGLCAHTTSTTFKGKNWEWTDLAPWKSEFGVHKGKCRQCPVSLLLRVNNCISSLESHCGFLTPDSSKAQKLRILKVEKFLYEPTMTMFHDRSCQVHPFLTLGNNMNILVDNLPVKHHSLPARRKESRVTMFL